MYKPAIYSVFVCIFQNIIIIIIIIKISFSR